MLYQTARGVNSLHLLNPQLLHLNLKTRNILLNERLDVRGAVRSRVVDRSSESRASEVAGEEMRSENGETIRGRRQRALAQGRLVDESGRVGRVGPGPAPRGVVLPRRAQAPIEGGRGAFHPRCHLAPLGLRSGGCSGELRL